MAAQGFPGASSNKTCQFCASNQATHFCDCKNPPTLFCIDCFIIHSRKDLRIVHQTIPIAALGRSLEDYKGKQKALMEAAAELRKNVERIDQCCNEVEEMLKKCVNYLIEYGNWWVQYMHREKEELSAGVEAAVLETTACLDQNTVPQNPLAVALWSSLQEGMKVVSYSVTTPDLQSILQTCISYENNLLAICSQSRKRSTT